MHLGLIQLRVPPNVKFEVDNCEAEWTFQQPFDLIHVRYMAGALKDWPQLARQCFENTAPGGWTEFQDFDPLYRAEDGSLSENAPVYGWVSTLLKASLDFGNEPCPGPNLAGWLKAAGFEDVQVDKFPVPIGPWPKDKHLVRAQFLLFMSFMPRYMEGSLRLLSPTPSSSPCELSEIR